MLKEMTPGNFNWFLHSMLFYHTKHAIEKQKEKASMVALVIVTVMVIVNRHLYINNNNIRCHMQISTK